MKRRLIAALSLFLAWSYLGTAMACPKTFGASTLKGSYVVIVNPDSRAEGLANTGTLNQATLGLLNFNGAGVVSGSATAVDNNGPITAAVVGTYQVSKNGTGTISLTAGPNPPFSVNPASLSFVLTDLCGDQANFVDLTGNGYNYADQGTLIRQTGTGFRTSVLNGSYVLTLAGQPGVAIGLVAFNGKGSFTGTTSGNADGDFSGVSIAGTYSMNPNGTGTMQFSSNQFLPSGTSSWQFVIGDGAGSAEPILLTWAKVRKTILVSAQHWEL